MTPRTPDRRRARLAAPERGRLVDDDVLVLEVVRDLVERNRKLEDENEDLRRLARGRPSSRVPKSLAVFDELIHADDDADADRRRVERRGASTVRYFVSVEGRMEKISARVVCSAVSRLADEARRCGAPRSLRSNERSARGPRNAARMKSNCERIAATTGTTTWRASSARSTGT